MSEIHSKISLHRFSLFRCQSIKIIWLLTIFIDFDFIHWLPQDVTTPGTTTTLFWKGGRFLNREKLDTYKPEDFKPGFEEKIRFFRFFKKIFLKSDNCLILRLSIATQLSTDLLFPWNQFSFLDEQMNRYIFRYKSMKSEKIKINR